MKNNNHNEDFDSLKNKINNLENRIFQLESKFGIATNNNTTVESSISELSIEENQPINSEHSGIESRFGEFGLAWMGTIVFLFGISFINQYFLNTGQSLIAAIFGYCAVIGTFLISHLLRKNFASLSSKLNFISNILIYYITLRLYFFSDIPLISNKEIALGLILCVVIVQHFFALKSKSELKASISVLMLLLTASISNTTHFQFIIVVSAAIVAVVLFYIHGWWKLTLSSMFFGYVLFLLWLLTNHILVSKSPEIANDQNTIIYLLFYVTLFSMLILCKQKGQFPDAVIFISVIMNGLFFSLLLLIYIVFFYLNNYIGIFFSIATSCLVFSVLLKRYSEWKFTPALYALYGFVSISIAVFGIYNLPYSFLFLSIQSLLVVSMAIWFRSKIIIVMNFVLFLMLLVTYLIASKSVDSINISFAIVPLVSARIINWQKERLDIKTDLLRVFYLIIGFFTVLYALYKVVPVNFVTLSWTLAAGCYFLLSFMLKNNKYRAMALYTLIATVLYLFIFDLARVDIIYRIIAFMVVAVISITISIYYSKRKKQDDNQ
ncbi:MAG: hypothetical protein A2033_03445 [Bacteroidetes bacterium GWA2_31_9]|nr:MAG: hypothetical protein A2033_03445 [Bacteroidetes bacterium GWA2_31_9]